MTMVQPGILDPLPLAGRYLFFALRPEAPAAALKEALEALGDLNEMVVGLGPSVVQKLEGRVEGLRPFPALTNQGIDIPSTQSALWIWLRGDEPGPLLHRGRTLAKQLSQVLILEQASNGFFHDGGRDLTGYEDGTENPEGEDAVQAAVAHQQPALQGSSFVAVQQWQHDFDRFDALTPEQQDDSIGRHRLSNEEFDAPPSAHVKRTAQEDFDPEAFVVRRSMPWIGENGAGLMFVAFGHSLDAFEAQLRRMVGLDDDIIDGLFQYSRPITGSYFWCPPLKHGKLDLSGIEH